MFVMGTADRIVRWINGSPLSTRPRIAASMQFNLNIIKFSFKPLKSTVTTSFEPPVLGKYTQSAVFSHELWLDA
jgi:hypothetical protein